MATRFFHADNCLRAFRVAGKEIIFKPYTNAGSWRGTHITTDDTEADALAELAKNEKLCLKEITAEDYSRITGSSPPLTAYAPIRVPEIIAQKIAANQVVGREAIELRRKELQPAESPKVEIEEALAPSKVETHAMAQEQPKRRGRPPRLQPKVSQ